MLLQKDRVNGVYSMGNITFTSYLSSPVRWIKGFSKTQDIVFLYLLALIPRLIFVAIAGQGPLSLDEIEYDRIAWYLSEGEGFLWYFGLECTFRPPVYAAFIGLIYFIAGPDYYIARLVQTFVIATQSVITYLIARELFSRKVSLLSGLIVALYLTLICFSVTLMSENLFISFLLLSLLFMLRFHRYRTYKYTALTGFFLMLGILTRPSLGPFVLLLLPWFYWPQKDLKLTLRHIGCLALIILIPVSMWVYRNYQVTGEFVYIDSRAGYNLYIGYNEQSPGNFHMQSATELLFKHVENTINAVAPEISRSKGHGMFSREIRSYETRKHISYEQYPLDNAPSDVWFDRYGKEQALSFMRDHPWDALMLVPKKFMYFWNLEHRILLFGYSQGVIGHLPTIPLAILFFCLLAPFVFIVIGSILYLTTSRLNVKTLLLLTPVAYLTVMHSLTFGDARFHYPIVPILAIFASGAVFNMSIFGGNGIKMFARETLLWRKILGVGLISLFVFMWSYGLYESLGKWITVFGPSGHHSYLSF